MNMKAGLLLSLALLSFASIAAAQTNEPPGTYIVQVTAAACTVEDSSQKYGTDSYSGGRYATGPSADTLTVLKADVNVPNGAKIDRVTFEVYDNDADQDVEAQLLICSDASGPGGQCVVGWDQTTSGTPNWQFLTSGLGAVIDNSTISLQLRVLLKPGSAPLSTMFRRAMFSYHLTSPMYAGGSFNDVPPTSPYSQFIEALAASGLTSGCGGGNYCPDAPVTRAQIAVFLAKALGLYWPVEVF